MVPKEEKEKFEKFLKALMANSQLSYVTANLSLLPMLVNFTRETRIRAGEEKAERAFKISEKILEALPQDLSFEELALIFAGILLAQMMYRFEAESEFVKRMIKEAELKKTSAMYV
ncbi:MAG: hypothetical protein QME47_08060 [Candidatus Thermoplasmatota archaeon]|nr:hypothetical protein [Candidatus Thermoplasmatota archaeon]